MKKYRKLCNDMHSGSCARTWCNTMLFYKSLIFIQGCCNCNSVTSPLEGYNEVDSVQRRQETREDSHHYPNENAHSNHAR